MNAPPGRLIQPPLPGDGGPFEIAILPWRPARPDDEGVGVGTGVGVGEGLGVGVGEGVGDGIVEGVGVGTAEGVGEEVAEGIAEGIGDCVGEGVCEAGTGVRPWPRHPNNPKPKPTPTIKVIATAIPPIAISHREFQPNLCGGRIPIDIPDSLR